GVRRGPRGRGVGVGLGARRLVVVEAAAQVVEIGRIAPIVAVVTDADVSLEVDVGHAAAAGVAALAGDPIAVEVLGVVVGELVAGITSALAVDDLAVAAGVAALAAIERAYRDHAAQADAGQAAQRDGPQELGKRVGHAHESRRFPSRLSSRPHAALKWRASTASSSAAFCLGPGPGREPRPWIRIGTVER